MDIHGPKNHGLQAGLVVILCVRLFCQQPPAPAEDAVVYPVDMDISPQTAGAGDQITVTFDVPFQVNDVSAIEMLPPSVLSGLQILRGPFRNYLYDQDGSGRFPVSTRIRYYLHSRESGLKELPVFRVTQGGGVRHESAPRLVRIGEYEKKVLKYPLEVRWMCSKDTVYVGEALPVMLRVENQTGISLIDEVSVVPPQGAFFEKSSGLMDIQQFRVADHTLYHIPAAAYIFIAPSPGRYFIKGGNVRSGEFAGTAKTIAVSVLSLPEDVKKSGAVGNFSMDYTLANTSLAVGREAVLEIRIRGTGNLPFLALLPPQIEETPLSVSSDSLDVVTGPAGYRGVRKFRYAFVPEKEGELSIHISDFPYLLPESGEKAAARGGRLTAKVEAIPIHVVENAGLDNLEPLSVEQLRKRQRLNVYRMPATYLALVPLPLGFLVFLLLRRFGGRFALVAIILMVSAGDMPFENAGQAYREWENGNYALSGSMFDRLLDDLPDNGGIYYNMSLCKRKTGQYAESLFFARKAVHLLPRDKKASGLLSMLESSRGLSHQVDIPRYVHPDISLLVLIIAANALAISGILFLYRKNIFIFIAAIIFGALVLIAGSVEIHGAAAIHSDLATLRMTVPLKRIPNKNAEDWHVMEEGTGVRVLDDTDGFYLVENGTGTRGWLEKGAILSHIGETGWRHDGFW